MNTLIKSLLVGTICASISHAASLSNGYMGVSYNKLNSEQKEAGFVMGLDAYPFMLGKSGFGIGFGLEANFFGTDINGIGSGYGAYELSTIFKAGYTFEEKFNIPLMIKTGIGYGVFDIGAYDGWGIHYEANAEYRIFEKYGIGVKYKVVDGGSIGNERIDVTSSMVYLTNHF